MLDPYIPKKSIRRIGNEVDSTKRIYLRNVLYYMIRNKPRLH